MELLVAGLKEIIYTRRNFYFLQKVIARVQKQKLPSSSTSLLVYIDDATTLTLKYSKKLCLFVLEMNTQLWLRFN